jgi:hypothetical protein
MQDLKQQIKEFLASNPSNEQIEQFYINLVLPVDNRSIDEILNSEQITRQDITDHITIISIS